MTGLEEIRYWEKGTLPSGLAIAASKIALEKAGAPPIDLLIYAGVCRDSLEPSTSSPIHAGLKLSPATQHFDISNACLGFVNAMMLAANMIESGTIETALITSGENSGPLLLDTIEKLNSDQSINRKLLKKYFANLSIGSAAVSIVLGNAQKFKTQDRCPLLKSATFRTNTAAHTLCNGVGDHRNLMMETETDSLLQAGIELATSHFESFLSAGRRTIEDYHHFVCHQVGKAHREALASALKLKNELMFNTFNQFGNTGSAALPLTFFKLLEQNKNTPIPYRLAFLGIGSGLSSIMMELEC